MLTDPYQDQIERDLRKKVITAQEAFALVTAKKRKPWRTKEWHDERNRLIGTQCVQCGSMAPPMVLQHLWQPRDLKTLVINTRAKYRQQYEATNPRPVIPEPDPVERPACPNPRCGSINVRQNKSDGTWACNNKKCGRRFTTPITVLALTPEQKVAWGIQKEDAFDAWNKVFRETFDEEIVTEAILESIADHRRYISLVDTTTFCKRCSDRWDQRKRRWCPECQDYSVLLIGTMCLKCQHYVAPMEPSYREQ